MASLRKMAPAASARTYPSAAASIVLHLPSWDSIPDLANATGVSTDSIKFAPALMALSHCPSRSEFLAECRLTRDDEQAVSTVSVGPLRSNWKLIRPDATLRVFPVATYPEMPLMCLATTFA